MRARARLEHLAQLRVLAVLGQQLLRARGVVLRAPPLLGELGGGRELVEQPPGLRVALPVRDHRGVGHLRLRLGEARLDLVPRALRSCDHLHADPVGLRRAARVLEREDGSSAATATASCASSGGAW